MTRRVEISIYYTKDFPNYLELMKKYFGAFKI